MQTLSWQGSDISFEEEYGSPQLRQKNMTIEETDENFQLKKFQDHPSNNQQRQNYFTLLEKFAVLLRQGDLDQIAKDLLTEDCEIFIFNSNGKASVRNAKGLNGFIELFRGMAIQKRRLRETNMDTDKSMACQICNYKITYDDSDIVVDEIACEIFSIRDGRISKYRGSFGNAYTDDPLEPTRKDKMLAKVKEINYALAGQPDFEKMASLLSENTEYKIWRWGDFKYFALYKKDFSASVKILEENMGIRNVVPYEISADIEGRFISGTYVYHLEDNFSGEKYDWLSTCIFAFDENINLKLISQQGELYPEGEIEVPFETQTREKLEKKIRHLNSNNFMNLHLVDSENVLYDCSCWTVCSVCKPGLRCFKGFKDVDKQQMKVAQFKDFNLDFVETLDIFVDFHNKSHDVVVAMIYGQGRTTGCCPNQKEKIVNMIGIIRAAFENGKLAKIVCFLTVVDRAIDSPFDDKSFQSRNIQQTNE